MIRCFISFFLLAFLVSCNSHKVDFSYCVLHKGSLIDQLIIDLSDSTFVLNHFPDVGHFVREAGKVRYTSKNRFRLEMPTHILEVDTLGNGENKTKFTVYDNRVYQELDTLIPFAFELEIGNNVYREDSSGSVYIELPKRIKEVKINDRIEVRDSSFSGKWYKIFELPKPYFRKEAYAFRVKKDHLRSKSGLKYYPCPPDSALLDSFNKWKSGL